jgi:hypothetical protein
MIENFKKILGSSTFQKFKRIVPEKYIEEVYFWRSFDKKNIQKFKNKYINERCFIVGNGPSLNNLDLKKLRNEYTFGVNSIFLKKEDFIPYFYVVEDHHVARDNSKIISKFKAPNKFFPRNYKHIIKRDSNTSFFNMNTGYYQELSSNYCIPRFSADASNRLYCGQSVTIICLQLAFYMGFKEVYLIGMDFNYEIPDDAIIEDGGVILSMSDDPNHFDSSYFGKGKRWHDPHLERVHRSYQLAKLCYEAKNRKIYNATSGGKLEIFERKDYKKLF